MTDDANVKTSFPPNNKVETNDQFSNEQQSNQIFNEQLIKSLKSQVLLYTKFYIIFHISHSFTHLRIHSFIYGRLIGQ